MINEMYEHSILAVYWEVTSVTMTSGDESRSARWVHTRCERRHFDRLLFIGAQYTFTFYKIPLGRILTCPITYTLHRKEHFRK